MRNLGMLLLMTCLASAQSTHGIFEELAAEMRNFNLDTTAPPQDAHTRQINELRSLRGAFNINEALAYKLQEARAKNELPQDELQRAEAFFTTGNGKKWLDNAVVWIYRKEFTAAEIQDLVAFYKTAAGRKMASRFPVIMAKSSMAAEVIQKRLPKQ